MEKTKRTKLEEKLQSCFHIITTNREMTDNIRSYYMEKNINSAVPMRIINNGSQIDLLSDISLCILVDAINITPNIFNIVSKDYFNDSEIQLAKNYKNPKLEKGNIITFHEVSQSKLISNIFICNECTFKDLFKLSESHRFNYNFATQREGKRIIKGDSIVTIPKENRKAINEIMEEWNNGTFTPNMITFNIPNPVSIGYDEINRTLNIELTDNGQIDVVDGWHRLHASINIMNDNPDFELGFYYVRIMNVPEERARKFIKQEDKHTPINAEHIKLMDVGDLSSQIAKEVQEKGTEKLNYLYHKFAVESRELDIDKYCLYSVISYPLKEFWNANKFDVSEVKEIQDFIYDKLNNIIGLNSNEFKNFKKSREHSTITMNGTFAFYMMILYKLYELNYHIAEDASDRNKFDDTVKEIIKRTKFDFDNPIWKEFGVIDENNNMTKKKISLKEYIEMKSYVEQLIEQINNESKVAE